MASGLVRSFSRGVPLPGMVAQGAASGAGIGALDIAARGGDPSEGALYGGAAGAAGPVVGKVAGEVVAPLARVVRGLRDPLAEAGRRVTGALDRDISGGNAGLSAQEFSAARRAGQPVALLDAGGETTRALMRSAANTSPEARGAIERFTSDQFAGQSGRVENWLNTTFNFPNADETQTALKQAARTVKHVAQLLTSNNVGDLDKGIKLISRNKTLFKAIQNADAAAGAVGTRGAVSGVTDSRASP